MRKGVQTLTWAFNVKGGRQARLRPLASGLLPIGRGGRTVSIWSSFVQYLPQTAIRGPAKLEALVAELKRRAELMSADIEEEKVWTGVSAIYDQRYSMLARALRGRRGNLLDTIATLEYQLRSAGSASQAA